MERFSGGVTRLRTYYQLFTSKPILIGAYIGFSHLSSFGLIALLAYIQCGSCRKADFTIQPAFPQQRIRQNRKRPALLPPFMVRFHKLY